jgi:hypothetical protein
MKDNKYIKRTLLSFMLPLFAGGHGVGPLVLVQIAIYLRVASEPSTATILTSSLLVLGQGLLISGMILKNEKVVNRLCRLAVVLLLLALGMVAFVAEDNILVVTIVSSFPFFYYSAIVILFGAVEVD